MLYLEMKVIMPKWGSRYCELGQQPPAPLDQPCIWPTVGKETEHHHNCIFVGSWFASVKTVVAMHDCGHEWIGFVKTYHSLFPKKLEKEM
jgi:hypothetical protein